MSRKKRILIVEDEAQVLFVASEGLKKLGAGYEILTATHGLEALAIIRQSPVDLLITDLMMPGMDGVTLTEVVKMTDPGTRVIWITALDQREADAQRLSVYRYLIKPLDVIEIRNAAKEILSKDG